MNDPSLFVLNLLLIFSFIVTASVTFKEFNPWAAITMILSLSQLAYINGWLR